MKKLIFYSPLSMAAVMALSTSFSALNAWAACPTGYIERYVQGSPTPQCLSESQLRSEQLRLQQSRQTQEKLSQERALQERQNTVDRQTQRLIRPR